MEANARLESSRATCDKCCKINKATLKVSQVSFSFALSFRKSQLLDEFHFNDDNKLNHDETGEAR